MTKKGIVDINPTEATVATLPAAEESGFLMSKEDILSIWKCILAVNQLIALLDVGQLEDTINNTVAKQSRA